MVSSPPDRRLFKGFLSHAHEDCRLFGRFWQLLWPRLAIDSELQFTFWRDVDLLVGECWQERIRDAIAAADFSLLLVSPAYLSRPFISEVEIPAILEDPAMLVMPVGLQQVDLARCDLQGLGACQIFRLQMPGEREGRFFSELGGPNSARFCDALASQISARCLAALSST